MRPYFDEIEVDGGRYLGPTAGHVPLYLIDLVLWAADQGTPEFHAYRQLGGQYTMPRWRALESRWRQSAPLISRVGEALNALPPNETVPAALRDSAAALTSALRVLVLVVFRGKHVTYARKTYPTDSAEYGVGSGGGTIAMLQEILDLTRQNANLGRSSPRPVTASGR